MEQYLIVDGYNMIGAWPQLAKLKDISLEESRDKLIYLLSDFQSFTSMTVYLVFDAHQVPGLGKKYLQSKLRILYTKEKETADELIERLVTKLVARRRQIYVATSDMIEQHVIFGKGALRMPASELFLKIKESRKEVRKHIQENLAPERNTFDRLVKPDLMEKLEKMRREK